ncbi:MAG: S-methyl-5-thioribose-1-phosphate isomerase [Vicinamibacteria bacterium]|nr:S-methyl-5-thioribose-1-phosphate isomerase [Vicinamibacteria bacterium]
MAETMTFDGEALHLLDQRALPTEVRYLACRTADEVARAIKTLVVRGAPAIGVAAAFGMALAAKRAEESGGSIDQALESAHTILAASRPTAVNLFWALEQMQSARRAAGGTTGHTIVSALLAQARKIHDDDIASCRAMGEFGATLFPARARVLTHCNAGALATAGYGTALGVIRSAHRQGKIDRVFADETRPVLQGARLTAWELVNEGIPTTLITDSMAGFLMSHGEINCVVVGADRIAANGDVINKIGTYTVAVLAREHGIPFFVAAPRSTFDLATASGALVTIEERDPEEVVHWAGVRSAPAGVDVRNPAFDVTPAALVAAIICETGVARPPFGPDLVRLARLPLHSGRV